MLNIQQSREKCWEIFRHEYPNYVNEDERYMQRIRQLLTPDARVLDAGCGWTLPFARQLAGEVAEVVGVDLGIDFKPPEPNVRAVEGNLEALPFPDASFDLVMSRSVLEHLEHPEAVFREVSRVLKPGGHFVFLIPNFYDYVSLASWMIPNQVHGFVVEKLLGRDPRDTFPTFYRANTLQDLTRLSQQAGMTLEEGQLLSQYPAYLMFSPTAFKAGIAWDKLLRQHESLAFLRSWILGVARRTR